MWWLSVEGPTATSKSLHARSPPVFARADTIDSRIGSLRRRQHAGQGDLLDFGVSELPHGPSPPTMFDVRRISNILPTRDLGNVLSVSRAIERVAGNRGRTFRRIFADLSRPFGYSIPQLG